MADSLITDLSDLFIHTIVLQPGYQDLDGTFIASGSTSNYSCYIVGMSNLQQTSTNKLDRAKTGDILTSPSHAIGGPTPVLDTLTYRYTLPSNLFNPYSLLEAIKIGKLSDENGLHHQTIYFA